MNKEKFPEYRNKVYKYIQEEIVPKNDEIESCNMHILPEYIDFDVEYIFNIKRKRFRKQKSHEEWGREIRSLLSDVCEQMGEEFYYLHIFIIIK